jgi:endonuclease/exonuclease/phosphatase (EEP) superfamily protein YafD
MTVISRLSLISGTVVLLALIGGHLNSFHPAFDSFSHFRLHLAAAGTAIAILLAMSRNPLAAAALGVISLLSFTLTVWPSLANKPAHAEAAPAPTYRLVQANLRFDNRTPEAFLRYIAAEKPDVITLQEVSDNWLPKLAAVYATWPHQKVCAGTNRVGGVAILSRRPFFENGVPLCSNSGALAVGTVDFNGTPVTVASLHLKWPWPHGQAQQLAAMAVDFAKIKTTGHPVLIGGDMNAAPWSAAVGSISSQTGTRIVLQVRGTWLLPRLPASWTRFVGLPIDNILASDRIIVNRLDAGPAFGSDHVPFSVEFSISTPEPAAEMQPVSS